ncbi:hypothetical protein [Mesonia aestuariivivens]|uniref:Peptidase M48 domain-containing protein n=1 Tax=Mesonia aestuariivivens TaxID=2796128 RepID=A0ABS6W403_9FLAO|nr:hypothetical protein [Mesonia aestuariivivens]MBW2962585.1 hypothetical protein [Mesonia aestuariivivens]
MKYTNKEIPLSIKDQVEVALSYYPQLKDTPIAFKFKKEIKKSTMQAQPSFVSFLKSRKNRAYVILISEKFHIEEEEFSILNVEDEVLIGWIGHELGHVMDYRERSTLGMAAFGLKYLFSTAHIQEVERAADTYAVKHGMYQYILATKNFILNNTSISPKYKNRIKRLYMSPEEIMELVNHLDIADVEKKVEKELQKEGS